MFVEQLRRAVEASPRIELARVAQLLWRTYGAGQITEAEATALSEAIELRRALPAIQRPVKRRLGSRPRTKSGNSLTVATGAGWSSLNPDFRATSSGASSGTRFTATSAPASRAPSAAAFAICSMWP